MSDAHATDAAPSAPGDVPEPPGLPEIRDEAGRSPGWLPLAGLIVLVVLGSMFGIEVWRSRRADAELARIAAAATAAQQVADAAEAEAAPAADPAAAPAPAPAAPTPGGGPPGGSKQPGHEGHDHP